MSEPEISEDTIAGAIFLGVVVTAVGFSIGVFHYGVDSRLIFIVAPAIGAIAFAAEVSLTGST